LFRKAFSTGPTAVNAVFNNFGRVQVETGSLTLLAGGTSTDNDDFSNGPISFAVTAATAGLGFGAGTYLIAADSGISGPGTVTFGGGQTDIFGNYAVAGPTNVTGGVVNFLRDAGSGAFLNQGGTVTIGLGST